MSREDIPAAAVHRLLKEGVTGDVRVSTAAVQQSLGLVKAYVMKAGKESAAVVKASKGSTVLDRHAQIGLLNVCAGVTEDKLQFVESKKRGLPVAGVSRVFRESASNLRVSAKVEKMVTAAATAYLNELGRRAALIMAASGRKTLLKQDVAAASEF